MNLFRPERLKDRNPRDRLEGVELTTTLRG